ncbi:hypothetical protein IKG54_02070 [Candidatus Saccharibacteria bacterium]|nr:hypothetical protein [Candidatus Saccharibacteria bacterium]
METNTLTTNEALVAGGIFGGMFAAFAIIAVVWFILLIIGWWKMFEKAGEKGWKAIIPIYNYCIAYKIAGMSPWWPVSVICAAIVVSVFFPTTTTQINNANFSSIQMTTPNVIGIILYAVVSIAAIVISIVWCFKVSKAFKRGIGTAILFIFFQNIMAMVIGFGSAKYDKSAKYIEK